MTRVLLVALALAAVPPIAFGGEALPRYDLTPGREIAFRAESEAGPRPSRAEWTVWTLRANADGSTRVVARLVSGPAGDDKGAKAGQTTRLSCVDLFPDGRVAPSPGDSSGVALAAVFPRLPADTAELSTQWVSETDGETVTAKSVGPGRFTTDRGGAMVKVYQIGFRCTYTFDPKRNLIAKVETEASQGRGPKTQSTTELAEVRTVPPDELTKLAADADRYFAATAAYDGAFKGVGKLAPDLAKARLDKALAALKLAAGPVTQPDLKSQLDEKLKSHDGTAKYTLADLALRAKVVGKPAYEVDATYLDGKPVKLADFKGKVVVLDFWYRGCGWCIKAMPQINELVGDFEGQPVAILGMNTDATKSDAEFVIKEMGLKYPTLSIQHESSGKFGVQGFPTLVILDQRGVVRDLHVGYSPTLRSEVGKAVRELLAEKKP